MEAKHKWSVSPMSRTHQVRRDLGHCDFEIATVDCNDHLAAIVVLGETKDLANERARIAAAAPELYEALRQCLTAIPQGPTAHRWEVEAAERARAAIAKATGGAS